MICQEHHLISERACPICESISRTNAENEAPAIDPQLADQGYTREQERQYEAFCDECAIDEEDRVRSEGLLECPECGERSVVASSTWTANYGGGYDTAYECANPECDYAEVCV